MPPSPQSSPSHGNSLTRLQSQTTCRVKVDHPPHLYLPSTQLGADTQSTRVDVCWLTGPSKLAGKSLKRSSIKTVLQSIRNQKRQNTCMSDNKSTCQHFILHHLKHEVLYLHQNQVKSRPYCLTNTLHFWSQFMKHKLQLLLLKHYFVPTRLPKIKGWLYGFNLAFTK